MGNRHAATSRSDELLASMLHTNKSSKISSSHSTLGVKMQQKPTTASNPSTLPSVAKAAPTLTNGRSLAVLTNSAQNTSKSTQDNSNSSHNAKGGDKSDPTSANILSQHVQNTLTRATMQRPTHLNITNSSQLNMGSKTVSVDQNAKQPACAPPPPMCACQHPAWHCYATPPPSLSDTSATSSTTSAITTPYGCNTNTSTSSSSGSSSLSASSTLTRSTPCHHCHYCHACDSREVPSYPCNNKRDSSENSSQHRQILQQSAPKSSTTVGNNSSTLITPSQSRPNLAVNETTTTKKPVVKRKRSLLLSACMPLTTAAASPLTPPAQNNINVVVAMPTTNPQKNNNHLHCVCKNHNLTDSNNNNNYRCYANCHQKQPRPFSRSCHHYCSEHTISRPTCAAAKSSSNKIRRNNSLRSSEPSNNNGHSKQIKQFLPPADSWNSGAEWRLPYGWEVAIDQTGRPYFINHEAKYTTYDDPRTALLLSPPPAPQPRTITLVRDPTIGFGFVASAEKPVIVRFVTEGGPSHGKLLPGDQILQVNGEDVENSPREHVINLVRSSSASVALRVLQPPAYDADSRQSTLQPNSAKKTTRLKNRRVTFADHNNSNAAPTTSTAAAVANLPTKPNQPPQPNVAPPLLSSPSQQQQFVPNVLKVFLENGQTKSFKYDAKTTVGDVMASLKEKLSIRHIEHFALAIENVRSQRRNSLHFLHTDDTITSIAARPTAQYLRCLFRLMFTPNDVNTLLQRDSVAFEYFYMQCCNDVVEERYANELRVDIALRLAALHMQQHAIANNIGGSAANVNKNVTVKLVEKECGLERFVPASILTTFNRKELRKILTTFIKLNAQYLAAPGQKRVGEMQAKLSYIKLLSELPSFGGKCFNLLIYPPNTNNVNLDFSPPSGSSSSNQQASLEALMLMSPKYGISQITSTPNGNPIQLCHLHDVIELTVRPNRNAGPSANAAQSDIDATLVDMRVAIDNVNSTVLTVGTESRDDLNDILCLLEGYAKCEHHKLPIHKQNETEKVPQTVDPTLVSNITVQNEPKTENNAEYGGGDDEDVEEDEEEEEEDEQQNREPAPPYYGQHAVLKMPWNFVHGRHVMSITLIDPDAVPATSEDDQTGKPVANNSAAGRRSSNGSVTQVSNNGYISNTVRDSDESKNSQHYVSTTTTASDEYDSSSNRETTPKAERRTLAVHQQLSTAAVSGSNSTTTTTTTTSSSPISASSYDNLLAAVCSDDSEQQARRLLQQQQLYNLTQQKAKPQNASVSQPNVQNNVTEIAVTQASRVNNSLSNPFIARDCTKFIDESATSSEVDTPVVDAPHVISYLLTSNGSNATEMLNTTSSDPFDYFGISNRTTLNCNNARSAATQVTSTETARLFYQALSKVPPNASDAGLTRSNLTSQYNGDNATRSNGNRGAANIDSDDDDDEDENSSNSVTPISVAGRSPAHVNATVVANKPSGASSAAATMEVDQTAADALFHRSCSSFGLQSPMSPPVSDAFKQLHVLPAIPDAMIANKSSNLEANGQDNFDDPIRSSPPLLLQAQGEIIDLTLIPLPEPSPRNHIPNGRNGANGRERKYSPPTIVIPPTPFRDDIDNMEQIFGSTANNTFNGDRQNLIVSPTAKITQQQQNRLARNAALLDETLQELDMFINQVTIPPPPPPTQTSPVQPSHHHVRSSSQDDLKRIAQSSNFSQSYSKPPNPRFSPSNSNQPLPSVFSPTHNNVVVLGAHYNSPAAKPPPVGGGSPVLGMRSKSATRVGGPATFSEARTLPNGSNSNRPSISGVDRPMILPVHPASEDNSDTNVNHGSLLRHGARPRPPPRDRVRKKVLHTMLHKSLEDTNDDSDSITNPQLPPPSTFMTESVSGEPTTSLNSFAIPGSPCDLAVYMDLLAERTVTKLDKLMSDMEWTAVNYCTSRPPEYNPAQMRVARDQLVCEARRFVSTSKSFVKSASMAFTHQFYNKPVTTSSMSEEHALVYVESLKRCTDLLTMMYYSAQLVARAAQTGEQAAGLMRGIMQVASTFRATVNASMDDKIKSSELNSVVSSGGAATTVAVNPTSSASLKELMCEATKLAASLTALMRTIRSTDMRDEKPPISVA